MSAGVALAVVVLQAQPVEANEPNRLRGDLPFSAGRDNFDGYYYSFSVGEASGGVSAPNAEPWAQDRPFGTGLSYGFSVGHNWQTDALLVGVEARALLTHDFEHVGFWAPGSLTFATDLEPVYDLRVRSGVVFDNVLVYGAAGYSVVQVDSAGSDVSVDGWNASVGFEMNMRDGIFLGADYTMREMEGIGGGITVFEADVDTYSLSLGFRF